MRGHFPNISDGPVITKSAVFGCFEGIHVGSHFHDSGTKEASAEPKPPHRKLRVPRDCHGRTCGAVIQPEKRLAEGFGLQHQENKSL